ncbi:MAG TPA: nickel-responsive transcriptional regulator NikR [Proteobacteria bacterium]|nr:nickel-responsive transcriptional regulator NikR [Pseudomonadota bacterium]
MSHIERIGVSIPKELLARFDEFIEEQGYSNRSEAIRDLIRARLVEEEWKAGQEESFAAVTLVYSHEQLDLASKLTDIQHEHYKRIVSTMHIHIDPHRCLEVVILRGKGKAIKQLAERLISLKGILHGKAVYTTTGKKIA